MEFSALFLSCVFHMLWRVMLDFSPTAGKPVSHLLCESWSYRGNGGNTEGFFIRAFDQDIVDFFLWRTINFHGNFPNPRSSQRWISQQDKSSSLSRNDRTLVETYLGHDHFHDGKHRYGFPRCHLTSLFWLGKLRRNAEELKGFWYLISMPSTTPGLCLAMSKWANELTSFPTKWRANEKHGTGWGVEHHPVTVFMYWPARERSHLPPKGKNHHLQTCFFLWGHGWSFPRRFFKHQFQPIFLMYPIFWMFKTGTFPSVFAGPSTWLLGRRLGTKNSWRFYFSKGKNPYQRERLGSNFPIHHLLTGQLFFWI